MKNTLIPVAIMLALLLLPSALAFSTLGLSSVDFDSNNADLAGPAFILLGVENGGSQYAQYSLASLASSLPEDYILQGTGTIKSSMSDYKMTFPVTTKATAYSIQQLCDPDGDCERFFLLDSGAADWCRGLVNTYSNSGDTSITVKQSGELNFKCLDVYQIGQYAILESPTHRFTDTITVEVSGKTPQTVTITESDRVGYTELSPGRTIEVKVQGALSDFTDAPQPQLERDAFFNSKTNNWNLINKMTLNEFNAKYSSSSVANTFSTCRSSKAWETCVAEAQTNAAALLVNKPYTNAAISGSTTGNGVLTITPTQVYKYPLFTLIIDADWVGIYRPVGKPVINSLTAPAKIIEGETSYITSTVSNDAPVAASFSYSFTCTGPFTVTPIGLQSFTANGQKTIKHIVSAETSTGCSSGSCTLTVKDVESGSGAVTKNVALKVCEANQCSSEGQQRCDIRTIQECRNINGVLVWQNLQTCVEGCTVSGSFATCTGNPTVPVCGDSVCMESERTNGNTYYCPADCTLPDPICGDDICDSRERSGTFACAKDCPPVTGGLSTFEIILISVSGVGILGAIAWRLKKEGYI